MAEVEKGKMSSPSLDSLQARRDEKKPQVVSHKGGARKTYSQKPADVTRKWYLLDASQTSVGRVATVAASLLLGKGKPTITAHVDGGDFVVIINADQAMLTGNKTSDKRYHYHSGFPGGLRTQTVGDLGNVAAIEEAVRGMLPRNKLLDGRLARLKVYPTAEHTHAPQQPTVYDLKKVKA